MKYRLMMALALAAVLGACTTMQAGGGKSGAEVATERQAGMQAIGRANAALAAETKKSPTDAAALSAAVEAVYVAGKDLPKWFPANSGPGQGFQTRAKPEIWSDPAFSAASGAFATALNDLHASKGADAATVTAKMTAYAGTCGGCHSKYRGPPPAAPAQ